LLNVLHVVGEKGAGFKSLSDAWADTTTPHGRLMLTFLAGIAEFERSLIVARTSDGRARAKAKGVKFGRKPSLTGHQREEALGRLANGEAQADVARSYNVSQATISIIAFPGCFRKRVSEGKQGNGNAETIEQSRTAEPTAAPT
jgi:DNA invertase Pin-like site-specific DNA recombinase